MRLIRAPVCIRLLLQRRLTGLHMPHKFTLRRFDTALRQSTVPSFDATFKVAKELTPATQACAQILPLA